MERRGQKRKKEKEGRVDQESSHKKRFIHIFFYLLHMDISTVVLIELALLGELSLKARV